MEYRRLAGTDMDLGVIGIGTEHMHALIGDEVKAVIDRAVETGVNFLDLIAWSPELRDNLGAALKDRRDKFFLAGHLGLAQTDGQYRRSRDLRESEELFNDLLARLGIDYVDVLHIIHVDEISEWQADSAPGGFVDLALRLRNHGKAKHIGMSGHKPEAAKYAVESGLVDVIMHPVHVLWDCEPGRSELFHWLQGRGTGLIAMKPYAGGAFFKERESVTPTKCISYTLAQPGVATIAVGVRSVAELDAALAYLRASDEDKRFDDLLKSDGQEPSGRCTYCNHCLPCASRIDIPQVNRLLASSRLGMTDILAREYDALTVKASACIECRNCERRCPFDVKVMAAMREAVAAFE